MTDAPSRDARWAAFVYGAAALFFAATAWVSYARWANFEYRSFDLAYYIQATWQLIHGRFEVSVLHVPLLGNHVEPIVILLAPLFAIWQHPMLFVLVQNAALAAMAPAGFSLARQLRIDSRSAALLAVALLLTPAAGYVALHEFHPEALTAPFLLLMLHARVTRALGRHWLWFVATLACKENMALVLAAYCVVNLIVERRRPAGELRRWYVWPLLAAVGWFLICAKVITPAFNAGDVDYLALYSHLGGSAGEIAMNSVREPLRFAAVIWHAATAGNLFWALLLPFLGLPLLKPKWLVVASPILFQHLLSWRSSEWTIYFHYAAPLLPLLWIGMVEVVARVQASSRGISERARGLIPLVVVLACIAAQTLLGPLPAMAAQAGRWSATKPEREWKLRVLGGIPADASVVAPLPYLSHLATREKLYSLHFILKGLKTLSRAGYNPPPPPDRVLIDYADTATFDPNAGFYHPAMQTADGRVIPSSDQLLHEFLRQRPWTVTSSNELTLLQQTASPAPAVGDGGSAPIATLDAQTQLQAIEKDNEQLSRSAPLHIRLRWRFEGERVLIPWMALALTPTRGGDTVIIVKGLCAPEAAGGAYEEAWQVTRRDNLPPGEYSAAALFYDNAARAWPSAPGRPRSSAALLCPPISLGRLEVAP